MLNRCTYHHMVFRYVILSALLLAVSLISKNLNVMLVTLSAFDFRFNTSNRLITSKRLQEGAFFASKFRAKFRFPLYKPFSTIVMHHGY